MIKVGIVDLNTNNLFSIYNSCIKMGFNTRLIKVDCKFDKFDCIINFLMSIIQLHAYGHKLTQSFAFLLLLLLLDKHLLQKVCLIIGFVVHC